MTLDEDRLRDFLQRYAADQAATMHAATVVIGDQDTERVRQLLSASTTTRSRSRSRAREPRRPGSVAG
jgi:hypothetical protein